VTGTKNRKSMSVGATPIAWTPPSATPSSPSSPDGGNGAVSCNGGGGGGTSGDSGGGGSLIRHAHSLPADVVGGGSGGGAAAAAAVIPTLDFLEEGTEDVFLNSPEVCVYTAHRIAHLSSTDALSPFHPPLQLLYQESRTVVCERLGSFIFLICLIRFWLSCVQKPPFVFPLRFQCFGFE
jgi:hypothetical protein